MIYDRAIDTTDIVDLAKLYEKGYGKQAASPATPVLQPAVKNLLIYGGIAIAAVLILYLVTRKKKSQIVSMK